MIEFTPPNGVRFFINYRDVGRVTFTEDTIRVYWACGNRSNFTYPTPEAARQALEMLITALRAAEIAAQGRKE